MTLFQLFKAAFIQPKRLIAARKKSFPKTFLYVLFLSIILTLPIIFNLTKVLQQVQSDFETIGTKIPTDTDFVDNHLTTTTKDAGFIYQTDYMIFTFDPEGKTNADNVKADLIGNTIGLAFLQDQLVFALADENMMAASLPNTIFKVNYNYLDASMLKEQWWGQRIQTPQFIIVLTIMMLFFALVPIMIDFALTILLLSLIANLFNRFRAPGLRFSDTFKIMVFSATLGVILVALVQIFLPQINSNLILTMVTIVTYYRVLPTPVRPPSQE